MDRLGRHIYALDGFSLAEFQKTIIISVFMNCEVRSCFWNATFDLNWMQFERIRTKTGVQSEFSKMEIHIVVKIYYCDLECANQSPSIFDAVFCKDCDDETEGNKKKT